MRVAKFLLLLLLLLSSGLHANLILNGSFESVPVAVGALYGLGDTSGFPGWLVTGTTCGGGCTAVLTNSYTEGALSFTAQDGLQAVDLTGAANTHNGGLQQNVNGLIIGQHYNLSFWVGNQDDYATANYGMESSVALYVNGENRGVFSNDNNTPLNVNWQKMAYDFIAISNSVVIQFQNATVAGDYYAGLDNVSLDLWTPADEPIPEPSTFGLLALGGTILAVVRRRRYLSRSVR